MTLASPQIRFTPDDVLRLEEEGLYELVDGKLVEKQMSSIASETQGLVTAHLVNLVVSRSLGKVFPEQTFRCFPDHPDLIRRPDIAFIGSDRLGGVADEGHVQIAPDLAIEVISPNDTFYEVDDKLLDYRSAGVKLVWVINPVARLVRVHRLDLTSTYLTETDTLIGESVLPGFSAVVSDLLPVRKV